MRTKASDQKLSKYEVISIYSADVAEKMTWQGVYAADVAEEMASIFSRCGLI